MTRCSTQLLQRYIWTGLLLVTLLSSMQTLSADSYATSAADVKMLTSLANTGRAEAQYRLANLYLSGQGVDQHLPSAMEWLIKSAQQQYAPAQLQLGLLYLGNYGQMLDCEQARHWFSSVDARSRIYDQARSSLAWLLATCPDDRIRNGTQALAIIKPLVEARNKPSPSLLDTLAAAYAETGDFKQAEQNQQKAIDSLEKNTVDQQQMQRFKARLQYYRQRQPWRLN